MQISLPGLAKTFAQALLHALKGDSARIKALALAEARKLAVALTEIARMLARGEIDAEEAAMLVRLQRHASETVLAGFADIGRVSASRAVSAALTAALESTARMPAASPVASLLRAVSV